MKCDELQQVENPIEWGLYYDKHEVDAAIAELKSRIHELESMPHTDNSAVINALETENAELKTKLAEEREFGLNRAKSADHEIGKFCAEVCELKAENRKLKRALWLARAEKARFLAMIIDQHPYTQVLHFTSRKRDDSGKPLGIARTAMEWWKMFKEVERKCRAKAESYL